MTKFSLALLSAATLALGACSSEPSDLRPNQKVSVDAVAAGTRPTGLYPSKDRPDGEGHAPGHHTGAAAEAHEPADASEAAATGSDVQQSGTGDKPVNTSTPESRAAADSAEAAKN